MHRSPAELSRLRNLLLAAHGEVREWIGDFPLNALADDPLDLLIGTVLSQATNDRNSSRAYAGLRQSFPAWEDVLTASEDEVARSIAAGGLNRQKARAIRAILSRLRQEHGALSLDFLRAQSPDAVRAYLLSLPGVGPKTAACVQLFALGQPAFPVDTHIRRIAVRLGLIPAKADPSRAQALLEAVTRPADCLPLHLLLIQHGRRICRPGKPRCQECPLRMDCRRRLSKTADGLRHFTAHKAS